MAEHEHVHYKCAHDKVDMSRGSLHPPSPRDAQSDVRSLPLTAKGWKMRHDRPDIKEPPSTGVTIQKRLAEGMKTHL